MKKIFFAVISLLFLVISWGTWGSTSSVLHLQLIRMKEAQPPRVYYNKIIFSFSEKSAVRPRVIIEEISPEKTKEHIQRPSTIRYVGVRFEHEEFNQLHLFELNTHGVFFLVYPLPKGISLLKYRIVVDGVWMSDPTNPEQNFDQLGVPFSTVNLKPWREEKRINPMFQESEAHFLLNLTPGQRVSILGDFNDWDPFMYPLTESSPGQYEIRFPVTPGRHVYYFLVDGRKLLDPYNSYVMLDDEQQELSAFLMD